MMRDEIVMEARRFLHLKPQWRHRGRTERGLDCLGLIVKIADKFAVPYKEPEDYARVPDGEKLVAMLKNYLHLVDPPVFKKGQVIVFRDGRRPCHVGIVAERYGQRSLIHCSVPHRGMHEEPLDAELMKNFRMLLDYPGVED